VTQVTTVITYGTFDLIHEGHINILRRAKDLGDHLIVGLSTEHFNTVKNKKAYHTYDQRKIVLQAIRYVDEIIPENTWEQKVDDIRRHHADIFVMGDDWEGKFDYLKEYCKVIYLPRTRGISTTKIKDDLFRHDR
jgi:glycerol-3-phosphate cytidylyltransferase